MPLSELDVEGLASALAPLDLPATDGWPADPGLVIACRYCGYMLRAVEADACPCGRLALRVEAGVVRVSGADEACAEVYRLVPHAPAA
jgi:hypothetical protein